MREGAGNINGRFLIGELTVVGALIAAPLFAVGCLFPVYRRYMGSRSRVGGVFALLSITLIAAAVIVNAIGIPEAIEDLLYEFRNQGWDLTAFDRYEAFLYWSECIYTVVLLSSMVVLLLCVYAARPWMRTALCICIGVLLLLFAIQFGVMAAFRLRFRTGFLAVDWTALLAGLLLYELGGLGDRSSRKIPFLPCLTVCLILLFAVWYLVRVCAPNPEYGEPFVYLVLQITVPLLYISVRWIECHRKKEVVSE